MKIKVKYHNPNCKFNFISKGEWVDLKSSENVNLEAPTLKEDGTISFDSKMISLGFSMELPEEFEAWIEPRSSTYKTWGIILANSKGVIDSSYSGNKDIWKFPAIALRGTTILEGNKICQFRIMPSQKASIKTKIKWLFTNKIEFVEVDNLCNTNRGGFGTTGVK